MISLFFAKVERSTKFCCFTEAKFSARNLFKLTSYSKFGFSRPDLDGNKLTKVMCKSEIEKCFSSSTKESSFLIKVGVERVKRKWQFLKRKMTKSTEE